MKGTRETYMARSGRLVYVALHMGCGGRVTARIWVRVAYGL